MSAFQARLNTVLKNIKGLSPQMQLPWPEYGRVCEVVGTVVEATLPDCEVGTIVRIHTEPKILAEVIGFRGDRLLLLPYQRPGGIAPHTKIERCDLVKEAVVGDFLVGGVWDAFLKPLSVTPVSEGVRKIQNARRISIYGDPINPLSRQRVVRPMSTGIRAVDSLLTMGEGQRLGIMAGSGVGKSVLMGMMARNSSADLNVIALIGERGREVREFIEKDLGEEGLRKSIVIAVTSDQSPLMKVRASWLAHAVARDMSRQGKSVLLMMDSLTRVAMAQREIGLAAGEPPTAKGYTPSVFSLLPNILEQSGPQQEGFGAISGIYTVLVDGDDFNDPIVDAARSILDGQINLTRRLASKGHFPAIDLTTSISRIMPDIVDDSDRLLALKLKTLLAEYEENFDLIQFGVYQRGSNPRLDEAVFRMPEIEKFLKQDLRESSDISAARQALKDVFNKAYEVIGDAG